MGNCLSSNEVERYLQSEVHRLKEILDNERIKNSKQEADISAYTQEVDNVNQIMQQKEVEISQLRQNSETEIGNLKKILQQREVEITQLRQNSETELGNLKNILQQKEVEITYALKEKRECEEILQQKETDKELFRACYNAEHMKNQKILFEKSQTETILKQLQEKTLERNGPTEKYGSTGTNFHSSGGTVEPSNEVQKLELQNMELSLDNQELKKQLTGNENELKKLNKKMQELVNMAKIDVKGNNVKGQQIVDLLVVDDLKDVNDHNTDELKVTHKDVMRQPDTIGWSRKLTETRSENDLLTDGKSSVEDEKRHFKNNQAQYSDLKRRVVHESDTTILDKIRTFQDSIVDELNPTALKNASSAENLIELSKLKEIYVEESVQKICDIERFTESLEQQVMEFSGDDQSKQYRHLEEMLIRSMVLLDKVESEGLKEIRMKRKQVLQRVQKCQEELKYKTTIRTTMML